MYFLAILIFVVLIFFNVSVSAGSIAYMIDGLSLILIILLTVPMLTGVGLMKDFPTEKVENSFTFQSPR